MGTQIDVLDILRKFDLRPKTVKDDEFIAEVSFERGPRPASDKRVDLFDLEIGNSLVARGTFPNYPLNAHFYATGVVADWFQDIQEGKTYRLKLQCLFEVGWKDKFTDQGPIAYKAGKKGFLIKSVEEEGHQNG